MKIVLKHINNRVYLKYFKKIKLKHYVTDLQEATVFEKTKDAKAMLNSFKHPENWEMKRI